MDLARKILFALEDCPYTGGCHKVEVEGYSVADVSQRVNLLREAGFIEAVERPNSGRESSEWLPCAILWDGHEFLDLARDDVRWEKAKAVVREKGYGRTLAALKIVLSELMLQALST